MQIVDSHCHLDRIDLSDFDNDLNKALDFARSRNISHFLNIAVSMENFPKVREIAEQHADVYCTCGVHPLDVENGQVSAGQLVELSQHAKVVAIGETGLDYFYAKESRQLQLESFAIHVDAANQADLPLVIHTRDAKQDTLDILRANSKRSMPGVMHCFTEDWAMAKASLDMGFYISISGIVTFKQAENVRQVVKKLPLDRLLIETDSPYLAPVPYRGKKNQPAYVREVGEFIAELIGVPLAELAEITTSNYFALFNKIKA